MKNSFLFLTFFMFLASCKSYEIKYDSRMKTEEMMSEEMNLDGRPFVLRIAFESSLKNEHVKVSGFGLENPADWYTYFDGKLSDCSEYSCKIIKVSSSVLPIIIYINDKKIILENSLENSPSLYKYLFISREGKNYKLYFSNYPKTVW